MAFSSHAPSSTLSLKIPPPMPPPPSLSDFQFRTIGQEPELLKRLSARNPDDQEYQRSPSPSSDPAVEHQVEENPDEQPSLHSRLSLFQVLTGSDDVNMQDSPNIGSSSIPNMPSNGTTQAHPIGITSTSTPLNLGSSADTPSSSRVTVPSSNFYFGASSTATPPSPILNSNSAQSERSSPVSQKPDPRPSTSQCTLQPSTDLANLQLQVPPTVDKLPANSLGAVRQRDEPTLASLRTLQAKFSKSVAHLTPVDTLSALDIARSAKGHCTALLLVAQRANTLAQQALTSAQESMNAAEECAVAAQSIQNSVDEVIEAVQKIDPDQGQQWNESIQSLKDDLSLLDKWARDKEALDARRQREVEQEAGRRQRAQNQPANAGVTSTSKVVTDQPSSSSPSNPDPSALAGGLPPETESAIDKIRKQNAERKRLAEEELRKRRAAEEQLEQENKRIRAHAEAQEAELARVRKERIKAEQEEQTRQQKEAQELERQKELERVRQETLRFKFLQQRQQEEEAQKEKEDKEKIRLAEEELEARLLAEQDQKRREIQERAELAKRLDIEKRKAEEQRQRQLREEQDTKRREIQARKLLATAETAAKIQADRANKQVFQAYDPKNSASPPNDAHPLPLVSATNGIPPPLSTEIGNVVSKKAVTNTVPTNKLGLGPRPSTIKLVSSCSSSPPGDPDQLPLLAPPLPPAHGSQSVTIETPSSALSVPATNAIPIQASRVPPLNTHPRSVAFQPPRIISLPHRVGNTTQPQVRKQPSLPPVDAFREDKKNTQLSTTPPHPADRSDITVDSTGSDIGNVPVIPRSQLLPLSPETRKANLRPFMDAHGIVAIPFIKSDPDEVKPTVKLERSSPAPLSQANGGSQKNVPPKPETQIGPAKSKPQLASNDIPPLSLPSPPASVKSQVPPPTPVTSNGARIANESKATLSSYIRTEPNAPQNAANGLQASVDVPSWALPSPPFHAAVGEEGTSIGNAPPQTARMQVPSSLIVLPPLSVPALPIPPDATINPVTPMGTDSYEDSSQMGLDAGITGGWSQPTVAQDELPDINQRPRTRRTSIDHNSPTPPSPVNIRDGVDPRRRVPSRRGDHYSPPRAPEPLPSSSSYDDYRHRSPPGPSRRGPESTSNSRGVSPYTGRSSMPRDDRRSLSQDIGPGPSSFAGRKRLRDEELSNAPPPRRSRYNEQDNAFNDPTTFGGPSNNDLGWSRSAVYERSPSPETRGTPLALRMDPEPVNSGRDRAFNPYKPAPSNNYRSYTHNQRYSPPLAHYEGDAYRPNDYRPNHRNQIHESRPDLLSRFTDSDPGYQSNRPPRSRVARPAGRGGGNYNPNNRGVGRGNLINRLQ